MKLVMITRGKFWAKVDDENYDKLNQWVWNLDSDGYAINTTYGQVYKLHKEVMGKAPEGMEIHHKDKDKLNNQKSNLEFVPRHHGRGNLFGYKGVSQHGTKFRATITIKQKSYHLGSFDEVEDAAKAYDKKVIEVYGPHAKLNFSQ